MTTVDLTEACCRECVFWNGDEMDQMGECRVSAPRPLWNRIKHQAKAIWPITTGVEWCGEFQQEPE